MKIHESCSTLSIYSFYKIIESNDYRYLIVGFEDESEIVLDSLKIIEFSEVFKKIINEYSELTCNTEVIRNYKLQLLIAKLEFKYNVSLMALDSYMETKDLGVLSIIDEYNDLKINYNKDFTKEILLLISKLKSLKNKIKIHKINHSKKFNKNKEQIKTNLDREALHLEMSLKLSHSIETRKTSVERWINMVELSKERVESYG